MTTEFNDFNETTQNYTALNLNVSLKPQETLDSVIRMKFILTGCTGFIGCEVLSQCLRNPTITSVVALSRRKLPNAVSNDPKLKVVIMKDFNSYPEPVLKELAGADACIWYHFPPTLTLSRILVQVSS